MWNDASVRRDFEPIKSKDERFGFIDAKGVEWKVGLRDAPDRHGRVTLDFASATGKRRSAEIKAIQIDELRSLSDQAWRTLLANAAVIEME